MGTVTTYNEQTGRFEVRDNTGNIVATGSTWREADFARQQVLFQNLPEGHIVRADVSEDSLSMTYHPYQQEQPVVQARPDPVSYADYQKSIEMGKNISKAQTPPPNITHRSQYYRGRLEMSEPKFKPMEGYETTTYNVQTGEKKVYPGVFTHDVSVTPVTEREMKEKAFETEMANITTQSEKKAIGSSIFGPVEAKVTSYVTGGNPPTGNIPIDVLGVVSRWAIEGSVFVGKSFELFTKPEVLKKLPEMGPYVLPSVYMFGKETYKFATEQPAEFIGQQATFLLMAGGLGKAFGTRPKVSTSIEAGEVFYESGKGFIDSRIITDVGKQRFFTNAKSVFTVPEKPGQFSKGITLGKTAGKGMKAPEYTVTASLSKSLGKFDIRSNIYETGKGTLEKSFSLVKSEKGFDISMGMAKTVKVKMKPEGIRISKPEPSAGMFLGKQYENLLVKQGIISRTVKDAGVSEGILGFKSGFQKAGSIIRAKVTGKPKPIITQSPKSPSLAMGLDRMPTGEQHIKMFAGNVEKSLVKRAGKKRPAFTVGGLYSETETGLFELDEFEFIVTPKDLRVGRSAHSQTQGISQGISQRQGQDSLLGQLQIKDVMQGTRQRGSQDSLSKQFQLQDVFQAQRQDRATSQLLRQRTTQRQAMKITPPPNIFTRMATPPMFLLPPMRGRRKKSKPGKKKPYRMRTRYTPTLAAVIFDISGAMPRQKVFSGVELRPMLRLKRRK